MTVHPDCMEQVAPGEFRCKLGVLRSTIKTEASRIYCDCTQAGPPVKKEMPSLLTEAWNVASAVLAFVANPGFVDAQTYHTRLGICNACDKRSGTRCTVCGCFIAVKARGKAWECPEKKWGAAEKAKPCGGCGK